MINYNIQEKLIKPTAKSCMWCKHSNMFSDWSNCDICDKEGTKLSHRLFLKSLKEEDNRYCSSYRYCKMNFKNWKNERKLNNSIFWEGNNV